MKTFFPTLLKNEGHKARLGQLVLQDTLAHAYLLQGPQGTGKNLFAHLLAASLSCQNRSRDGVPLPCGSCPACEKILADKTPDIHHVSAGDAASIGIAAIHAIKEDMYLSATEMDKKVYVIHDAEKMTTAAQNALLIVLEEPPPDVVIFLLTENASALLPTIQSRVQTIRMSLFTDEELRDFLGHERAAQDKLSALDGDHYRHLIRTANGSPGKALSLLQSKDLHTSFQDRERIRTILLTLGGRANFLQIHTATAQLATKRQELAEELQLLIVGVRDLIIAKREESAPLCFFTSFEDAEECCSSLSLRSLFHLYDALCEALKQIGQNANVNTVLSILNTKFSHVR